MRQPVTGRRHGRLPRVMATSCCLAVLPAAVAAMQDCRLEYAYASSPTTQTTRDASVVRGQTTTINRTDMLWLVNKKDRKLEVQITMPTGGSKWVALNKDQRDPPVLNYIGNVTLQKVKCHYLHESPVAMFTATYNGQPVYQYNTAKAIIEEFQLNATQFLQNLQPHLTATTVGRLLRDAWNQTPAQIAATFKQYGYTVTAARDALAAATTQEERWALVTSPNGQDGAILAWLIGSYDKIDAALAMAHWSSTSSPNVSLDHLIYMMKASQYTPAEAARVIHLEIGAAQGGLAVADTLYVSGYVTSGSYTMSEIAQGLAAEFNATPVQVAQWIGGVLGATGLGRAADALHAFSPDLAQITTWLVQAGFTLTAVADGMAHATTPATITQVATGFRNANVDAGGAIAPFRALQQANSSLFGGQFDELTVARAMHDAGYAAGPLAIAMKQVYSVPGDVAGSHKLAAWLTVAGYSARDCVDGMRAAFPGDDGATMADRLRHPTAQSNYIVQVEYAAAGLKASYGASSAQVGAWLDDPWTPREQARGIFESLTKSGSDVAAWMKNTREPRFIGGAMGAEVTDEPRLLAGFVRTAGFQPVAAAEAVRYMGMYVSVGISLLNSPQNVAIAMRDGGFTFDAILDGINGEFTNPVTREQLASWLCSTSGRTSTQTSTSIIKGSTTTTCPAK
jgi:hypothetical protein